MPPTRDAPSPARAEPDLDLSWGDDDGGADGVLARLGTWFVPGPGEVRGLVIVLTIALALTATLLVGALRRDAAPAADPAVIAAATGAGPILAPDGDSDALLDERDGSVAALTVGPIMVHVTGAVLVPGLVTLEAGSRVGDAVAAAGGLTSEADLVRVNLARALSDGEHVHVLRIGEEALALEGAGGTGGGTSAGGAGADGIGPGGSAGARLADGRLDINRAGADELVTLPGIGPAKAAAIVDDRTRNGPFRDAGDIRRVSGIGEATFQRIAELIAVG